MANRAPASVAAITPELRCCVASKPFTLAEVVKRRPGSGESAPGKMMGREWAKHESVNHGIGEYVRGGATVNACENYFSILKRGIYGTYQHVSPTHLKRYVAEFDFRYNNRVALEIDDAQRANNILDGVTGKRLTYQTIS